MPKVPDNTSSFATEPMAKKYVIPFAPELIQFIKDNQKVQTYRYGRKYDYLNVGDYVELSDVMTNEVAAKAKIINKSYVLFSELPLTTDGHETYRDKEHQRQVFSGYYQYLGRPIADTDEFLVLDFELID